MNADSSLKLLLRTLRLPAFVAHHESMALTGTQAGWTFGQYLRALADIEVQERSQRRVDRTMKAANLPLGKTRATLEEDRLPPKIRRAIATLCEGGFVDRAENILAFGLPGRGKTHVACAIAHELILKGYRVLFSPTYKLVQRLLVAKRDLTLDRELKRLDRFDVVILDDLGYVQQDRSEMEVLFTFLAERYERKSVIITSNLVFSKWDTIFKDAMTTAAAIDRLVHHSTILELTGDSYRTVAALTKQKEERASMQT
ncbi:MAG TPA: AAA family ATPase [Roseibacterium sp.]|nr:AAA family ATPase [Roseibacterium sp.]